MPKDVQNVIILDEPQGYEDQHVHAVYDQIASHFSSTRYKPWPIISAFLESIPDGSLGLDAGTGNGKYLPLPLNRKGGVRTIGLDRSRNLLAIAQTARSSASESSPQEVVLGDVMDQPWRPGVFDYAISIATIHHLASHERRILAVQRLMECVSPAHGRILIYVWAIEQDELSKRSIPAAEPMATRETPANPSSRTPEKPQGQDVFVPWVRAGYTDSNSEGTSPNGPQVFNRYYHMFAVNEILVLVHDAARSIGIAVGKPETIGDELHVHGLGVEIIQHGWERSNHYVELRRWKRA